MSKRIAQAADRYIKVPHEIGPALDIVAQELDILHYPDIGMAPFTYGLAHSRLAPMQTVDVGTSGHKRAADDRLFSLVEDGGPRTRTGITPNGWYACRG